MKANGFYTCSHRNYLKSLPFVFILPQGFSCLSTTQNSDKNDWNIQIFTDPSNVLE
ncbi:hypothetical protein ADIS_3163 [Lunatimonas lonarensis]|uniref:Uncharacterized protein n=1 Tax=Lunatimonas lonarensis TaxID=1232681 RepID=R7ZQH1_9BACT|nr:hypothetical protein ADIS_3163 [Lunatimonas lonarensis]